MVEDVIEPKPSFMFFFKNIKKLLKMKLSNSNKIENFLENNKRMETALVPNFEGFSGPMEEGMIYLLFNSKGKDVSQIDTIMRIFWVSAPDLNFHQVDSYLISTNLESKQWDHISRDPIFTGQDKDIFKQEVSIEQLKMKIEGKFPKGYEFEFDDKILNLTGKFQLTPIHPEGVITYYNGRWAINPSAYQRFYDIFALKAEGQIKISNNVIDLSDARAIVEHSIGIFSTYNIKEWVWLNIQYDNNSIHIFWHPLKIDKKILHTAEGAAIIGKKWYHFLKDDIAIKKFGKKFDEIRNEKVPTSWNVSIKLRQEKIIDLNLETLEKLSWITSLSDTDAHHVTNYLLNVNGKVFGEQVTGKATLEYLVLKQSKK